MPSTIGELFGVLKNRHPLIDHHLGSVTNIIQEAKQNAYAFEEVAAILKREHLEGEQAAQHASKTAVAALITSIGSSNVRQIKQPLNLIFGTFNQKSMADLDKGKAADSRGVEDESQETNKGVFVANVSSSFQNVLQILNEVNMENRREVGRVATSEIVNIMHGQQKVL